MLRARPGRGAAAPRRRRGRGVRVPARPARAAARGGHDPAAHARRRAVRRRPRPLRALRAARARRAARSRRRDAARQRPVRPPLAPRHARRCSRSPPCPPPSRARSAATCPAPGPAGASPSCRWASRSTASARSRARRRARGSGSTPPAPTCCSRTIPSRPLKRFDRAREAAGDVPLLHDGPRPARRGPVLDQRRERRARPVRGRGLRPLGDRGARVRRAGVRRHRSGSIRSRCTAIDGAFCEEWDAERWRAALAPVLAAPDPRVDGRARAELFSADRMADRVVEAWRAILRRTGRGAGEPLESGLYSALRAHRRPRSGPTMSGLLRRIKRSRPADAGEPPVEGPAAAPEGRGTPGRSRRGARRRDARRARRGRRPARLADAERARAGRRGDARGRDAQAGAEAARGAEAGARRGPEHAGRARRWRTRPRRARPPAVAAACGAGCATCAAPAS